LLDELVISGREDGIGARLADLRKSGIDEAMVWLLGVDDPESEGARLSRLIGELSSEPIWLDG
jgi:hypothetical protein